MLKNKTIYRVLIMLLGLLCCGFTNKDYVWEKLSFHFDKTLLSMAIHPIESNIIFVGTDKMIYRSIDHGNTFQALSSNKGPFCNVSVIKMSTHDTTHVYFATEDGAYSYDLMKEECFLIFKPADLLAKKCLSLYLDSQDIYIGTEKGLYYKNHNESVWQKESGVLGHASIYNLETNESLLYIATESALFKMNKKSHDVVKIFNAGIRKEVQQSQDTSLIKDIHLVSSDLTLEKKICVVTDYGIFMSQDEGMTWKRHQSQGLPLGDIKDVFSVSSESGENHWSLFVGTQKGVYRQKGDTWISLYKGMYMNDVGALALSQAGQVYALTAQGLYRLNFFEAASSSSLLLKDTSEYFKNEPTIKNVHQLAIDYAEVGENKIKQWREKARKKAWLPSMSIGLDAAKNKTLSDSLWGSSSSGGTHYIGPDDKTFYDNFGWDVSLSWDWSELVWSSDQLSIDSRGKMMVELREDILDQVTRLYFERRRLQFDVMLMESDDRRLLLEKEMRIQELSAQLDALTGGKFTNSINTERKLEEKI